MSVIINVIMLLVLLGVGLALPITIGVYVYRDATRRGMNAAMWTLIALLAPSLIGFIIYLIIRGNYSDLECPNCKTPIKEDYVRCPKCGSKLRPSCPNCSAPVETDWTVCPRCATELPQTQTDTVVPVRRKDKSLGKILLIVILVPLLLILLMFFIFGMRMYNTIGSGGTSIVSAIAEEYLQDVDNEQISQWYNDCKESDKVHVLRHESLVATGEQEQVRYLIYMPNLEDPVSLDFDNNAGFFQTKLRVDYSSRNFDKFDGKALLVLITCSGDDADLDLEIYCDDEKMNYELSDSDIPIGLTDNVEKINEEWYSGGGKHNAIYVQPEEEKESQLGNSHVDFEVRKDVNGIQFAGSDIVTNTTKISVTADGISNDTEIELYLYNADSPDVPILYGTLTKDNKRVQFENLTSRCIYKVGAEVISATEDVLLSVSD